MGKITKAALIRSLEQAAERKQRVVDKLQEENDALRTRQSVLLSQVAQQGENVHFVALAASQVSPPDQQGQDKSAVAKALMQDMQVAELLRQIGRYDSSSSAAAAIAVAPDDPRAPFTHAWLRAAITPERVAAIRRASVKQVAEHLQDLTMRMCMLLAAEPARAAYLQDSIEDVMQEYGEYALLLHVAADQTLVQLGSLNLDTLQEQQPPPGHWEAVVEQLDVTPAQVTTLTAGFRSYQAKSSPAIAALNAKMRSIGDILAGGGGGGGAAAPPVAQQAQHGQGQGQGQGNHGSADGGGVCGGGGGSTHCASGADAAAAACGQQQQAGTGPVGTTAEAAAAAAAAAALAAGPPKPWQQFGLTQQGGLTLEAAEQVEADLKEMRQLMMRVREQHRTVAWLYYNTLTARQNVISIAHAWPWWSQPIYMCRIIAETMGGGHTHSSPDTPPHTWSSGAAAHKPLPSLQPPHQQQQQQPAHNNASSPHAQPAQPGAMLGETAVVTASVGALHLSSFDHDNSQQQQQQQ